MRDLRPLSRDYDLSTLARTHSAVMATSSQLFHSALGYAENVGVGSEIASLHRTFMRSPPHRRNILTRHWRAMGVGVWSSGDRFWVTVVFRE